MRKPGVRAELIAGVIILAVVMILRVMIPREQSRSVNLAVFNTVGKVTLWGTETEEWDAIFRELAASLQELHNCFNVYDAESELSRLNAGAFDAPFKCSDTLWAALCAAREAYVTTHGCFDVTVGPLMRLWGYHGKQDTIPTQAEIDIALQKVGMDKVIFDEAAHAVTFAVRGMSLDLGGMAKGYACDVAAQLLQKHNVQVFLIDLGGNLMLSEKTPSGRKAFTVGIRNPAKPQSLQETIELRGTAVATSGNYERSRTIAGRRIGHIMNPRTGQPAELLAGVTVITPRGINSDVFSTAVFAGGTALAKKLADSIPGTAFVITDNAGVTRIGTMPPSHAR